MGETLDDALDLAIERATGADALALAGVAAAAMTDPWSELALREEVAHPHGRVWTARCAGRSSGSLGFLAARGSVGFGVGISELRIVMLAVHPEWRRRGVGSALARTALRFAWYEDLDAVHLEVRARNDAAQALYGELGFVVAGTRPRYYRDGEHAVVMSLDLNRAPSSTLRTTERRP